MKVVFKDFKLTSSTDTCYNNHTRSDKMYLRFRSALLQPKMIPHFIKDSWLKVWGYFFLLMIVLMIPFAITIVPVNGLRGDEILAIEENFSSRFFGPYEIENGKLLIEAHNLTDEKYLSIDNYTIRLLGRPLNSDVRNFEYIFLEEGIRFTLLGREYGYYPYEELGLQNFTFNDYSNKNIETFVKAINYIRKDNDFEIKSFQLSLYFGAGVAQTLFFILLTALLTRTQLSFKNRFKLIMYASTIYVICVTFGLLFGLNFLSWIGMLLLIIYSQIALSQFVVN